LHHALKTSKLAVLTASTPDQAVAICVANVIAAAVVDGRAIRGHEWSVVKSLKMIRPSLHVILLEERQIERSSIPEGVSAIIRASAVEELVEKLKELMSPCQIE
jgi:ActR/RegA family two-component response regulator